jgi:hypothetical protein
MAERQKNILVLLTDQQHENTTSVYANPSDVASQAAPEHHQSQRRVKTIEAHS